MAGGTTNHFWPVSRESRPKQFLDISGSGKSFIRLTYERFSKVVPRENILVVTLSRFGEIVREQIPELPAENLLLEPYSRNTAPCIAYSTYEVLRRNPEATIVATPADHIIRDVDLFCKVMENVVEYAESNDVLMTVGILPDKPDTNYGYIQVKGGKATADSDKPLQVKTFVEKPDRALAEVFCNSEEFYWNSGIFVWKAAIIKEEMEKYIPDVTALFRGWETILGTPQEKEFLEKAYSDCQKISID
jgi:mannose-1-phosphate guanylyltransferase